MGLLSVLKKIRDAVKPYLKPVGRVLAACLIGATGVGLFYLWDKWVTIKKNERGISYDGKGDLVVLPEGNHLLLSPFHNLDKIHSLKEQVISLPEFETRTKDGYEIRVQSGCHIRIMTGADSKDYEEDKGIIKAITEVEDYEKAVRSDVESTICNILQEHLIEDITTTHLFSPTTKLPTKDDKEYKTATVLSPTRTGPQVRLQVEEKVRPLDRAASSSTLSQADEAAALEKAAESYRERLCVLIKDKLIETFKRWGITVSHMRLIRISLKNENDQESLRKANEARVKARAEADALRTRTKAQCAAVVQMAKSEAKKTEILARGRGQGISIFAQAAMLPNWLVHEGQVALDQTRALGSTTGSLTLGAESGFRLFERALNGAVRVPQGGRAARIGQVPLRAAGPDGQGLRRVNSSPSF